MIEAAFESSMIRRQERLVIYRTLPDQSLEVLDRDGSWVPISENVQLPHDLGFRMPKAAVEAVARACAELLGNDLPSTAEVKVLRESLEVERGRVDRILDRSRL